MTRPRRLGTATVVLGVLVLGVLALAGLGLWRAAGAGETPSSADRVAAVAATLRCPTCQGQSVEDSTSVLAAASRRVIAQQLDEGRTPDEIRQWFVDRYGRAVLLSPESTGPGVVVWLVPGLVLLAGGTLVWRWVRRSRAVVVDPSDGEAATALAAWQAGRLDPDDSPAGEELREALLALASAEEDQVEDVRRAASRRLGAAYRRYTARPTAARPTAARPTAARSESTPWLLPRRAATAAAAGALLVVTGIAVVGVARGSSGDAGSGSAAVPAATGTPPAPPPGWRGGMPRTVDEWVALGLAYDRNRQLDQAAAAYTMALRLQPADDGVLLMRADVLVRSGRAAQALPDLEGLNARHPDTPDVLLVLGLAENRTGAPAADATLQRFLQLAPGSPAAPGVRRLLGAG
jgi:cytochrome c-type biogenesis protein CcmH